MLLLHADHLASSHADALRGRIPSNQRRYGRSRFRFTFLQHGVINYDMSRWLSWKNIDLFVTTTPAEYEADRRTRRRTRSRRTRCVLTGLPRHDASSGGERGRRRRGPRSHPASMPTWRQGLLGERVEGVRTSALAIEDFGSSEYAKRYARAPRFRRRLRDLAPQHGQAHSRSCLIRTSGRYLDRIRPPRRRRRVLDFADERRPGRPGLDSDVRDGLLVARFRCGVPRHSRSSTSSSTARPSSTARTSAVSGYFDFTRHGFGPVEQDEAAVISALEATCGGWFHERSALRRACPRDVRVP